MSRKAKPLDNDSVISERSARYNLRHTNRSTSSRTVDRRVYVSGWYSHLGENGGKPANFGFVISDSIDEDVSSPMSTGSNNSGRKGTTTARAGKGHARVNANNQDDNHKNSDDNDDEDVDDDVPVASVLSDEGDTDVLLDDSYNNDDDEVIQMCY